MSSWIEQIPDDEWAEHPDLADQHSQVVDRETGKVDHILAVHSINPRGLAAHNALYMSAMAGTATLRKVERELIAYVVSAENHCHY